MGRLDKKIAIITGGARGMGAATVKLFVEQGARVVIADVLEEEGTRLAAGLGDHARFLRHDVTDEASWARVIELAEKTYGPPDVLVNNAGVLLFRTILETSKADYERVTGINLTGTFLGVKLVGGGMVARKRGSIVNISSTDGMKGANGLGAYSSSKWGIRGLTRVAAMEFGHQGVRVNSIHPGGIDTVMANPYAVARDELDKQYKMVPMQRAGAPSEVAQATAFLASDDSSYMCGAELAVDGGMLTGQYYVGYPGAPA